MPTVYMQSAVWLRRTEREDSEISLRCKPQTAASRLDPEEPAGAIGGDTIGFLQQMARAAGNFFC